MNPWTYGIVDFKNTSYNFSRRSKK